MKTNKVNFTNERISNTKPHPDKDLFLWDTKQAGLGIRIKPTGHKTYIFGIRMEGKGYRQTSIKSVTAISLEKARSIARKYCEMILDGKDPFEEKKKEGKTFYEVIEEYLKVREHGTEGEEKIASTTLRNWKSVSNKVKNHSIGKTLIKEVTLKAATTFFSSLYEAPVAANRLKEMLILMWRYAMLKEYIPLTENIWFLIKDYKQTPTRKRLIEDKNPEKDEPTLFFNYMKKAQNGEIRDKRGDFIDPSWIGITLTQYFSGARPIEIIDIKISEINREKMIIHRVRSKTGEKDIQISEKLLVVLDWCIANIRRHKTNPYLFAGSYGRGYRKTWQGRQWNHLKETLGLKEATPYSMRRYFASTGKRAQLLKGNTDLETVSKIMSHKTKRMTEEYAGILPEEHEQIRILLLAENNLIGSMLASKSKSG
jgi:integrase